MSAKKLRYVNVCLIVCDLEPNWSFELHSSDGTVWTIERGRDELEATARAEEFGLFAGLPVRVHGVRIKTEGK